MIFIAILLIATIDIILKKAIFIVIIQKIPYFYLLKQNLKYLIFYNSIILKKTLIGTRLKVIILLVIIGLAAGSCQRARYRKMLRKRRNGHIKKKAHRSEYQKKLRKSSISTGSKYHIKNIIELIKKVHI